jgi:hypothetical protein
MLEWDVHVSGRAAHAEMLFVIMRANTYDNGETFSASIENVKKRILKGREGFVSLDTARAWCEAAYKELLATELARLELAAQG